jgi:hypothetical protein
MLLAITFKFYVTINNMNFRIYLRSFFLCRLFFMSEHPIYNLWFFFACEAVQRKGKNSNKYWTQWMDQEDVVFGEYEIFSKFLISQNWYFCKRTMSVFFLEIVSWKQWNILLKRFETTGRRYAIIWETKKNIHDEQQDLPTNIHWYKDCLLFTIFIRLVMLAYKLAS